VPEYCQGKRVSKGVSVEQGGYVTLKQREHKEIDAYHHNPAPSPKDSVIPLIRPVAEHL
jgi:hypothetical protein